MTKLCKKSFIVILALCIAACLMSFVVACGDDTEDTSVTYTITVYTDNDTPAVGVDVTVKKGSAEFDTKSTDTNGKVEFRLAPDNYVVELDAQTIPAHYGLPEDAELELTAENRTLTVALARNFEYTIKLVNPDGTPYTYNGAKVLCCTSDGNCKTPVALGADGIAVVETNRDNYHVKVEGLPDTVAYESDSNGYYTGAEFTTTSNETEMEITVYPVTAVTSLTPMTAVEKLEYSGTNWMFSPSDAVAYHVKKTLAPGETVYYSLTPEFDSKFNLYKEGFASYLTNGTGFKLGNNGQMLNDFDPMKADTTYRFNVTNMNSSDLEIEFVVECPLASHHQVSALATLNVTVNNEYAHAIVEFKPTTTGAYKLKAKGTQLTSVVYATSLYYAKDAEHTEDSFVQGAEASAKVTQKELGAKTLYFSIAVKDAPVSFNVSLEKVGEVEDDKTVIKHTEETLTQFNNVTGKILEYVPVDGSVSLVYNNTDKFYHLGTADGPIVVVKLTKPIDDDSRFYPGVDAAVALTELDTVEDEGGSLSYIMDTTTADDLASLTKGNTSTDFRVMLRGFTEWNVQVVDGESVYVAPTTSEPSYYAKYVNSDGVYPLTKELEAFLKLFAENYSYNMPLDAEEGYAWLFACYFYDDGVIDPIVGEYNLVSFTLEDDEYTVGSEYNDFGNPLDVTTESFTLKVTRWGWSINDKLLYCYDAKGKWNSDGSTYHLTITIEKQNPVTYKQEQFDVDVEVTVNTSTGEITITRTDEDAEITEFKFIKKSED